MKVLIGGATMDIYDCIEKENKRRDLIIMDELINKAFGRKAALPDNESLDIFYTRQQYRDDYIIRPRN